MLKRFLKPQVQPDGAQPATGADATALGALPLFPSRDATLGRTFATFLVRTSFGTLLQSDEISGALIHDSNPRFGHQLVLYRSMFAPDIGIIVASRDLQQPDGMQPSPMMPVLLVDVVQTGHVALRDPIRPAHVCALDNGTTDYHRDWIGPWEQFELERVPPVALRPTTEAALIQIGLLLEKDLALADVVSMFAETPAEVAALARPVILMLMARWRVTAAAARRVNDLSRDVHVRSRPAADIGRPYAGRLEELVALRTSDAAAHRHLRGSWRVDRSGRYLASGLRVAIDIELPYRPQYARLRLELAETHHAILMTVSVDGWQIARTPLSPRKARGSRIDYWIPREAMSRDRFIVTLDFDVPPPLHGPHQQAFELTRWWLHAGSAVPGVTVPDDPAALFGHFESLGGNSEFGFVQKHFGVERIGMFSFARVDHLNNLVTLLESGVGELGEPGTLIAEDRPASASGDPDPSHHAREYVMRDDRSLFEFHSFTDPREISPEQVARQNETKLRFMHRQFIEDVEGGGKIWVLRDTRQEDYNEVLAIHDLLNQHRPNKLLWVSGVIEGREVGAVEWMAPNLLRGYAINSHADPQRFSPDIWLELCRNAYRAFAEQQAEGTAPAGTR